MSKEERKILILTNGLTEQADEGFLNVANQLIKRIKKMNPNVYIASYERKSDLADRYFVLNKLFLNPGFLSFLSQYSGILYLPFPSKTFSLAVRIILLSRFARGKVNVLLVMRGRWNWISKKLLLLSGAYISVLSREANDFYCSMLPENRVKYIKAGVDMKRFLPVGEEKKILLKEKYGLDSNRPVVLHVGHLSAGRNIGELLKIDLKYQVVLVLSSLTSDEQDMELKEQLKRRPNIIFMEGYLSHIEEIYQMADIYFFPTVEKGHCIDVPLSCLEAASCNKPVITTKYGEMEQLVHREGFYLYDPMSKDIDLNELIKRVLKEQKKDIRKQVLEYDWDEAVMAMKN